MDVEVCMMCDRVVSCDVVYVGWGGGGGNIWGGGQPERDVGDRLGMGHDALSRYSILVMASVPCPSNCQRPCQ